MNEPRRSNISAMLAIALLLLPTAYVASYFALVLPQGAPNRPNSTDYRDFINGRGDGWAFFYGRGKGDSPLYCGKCGVWIKP